jgi:hypothetical protein
MRLAPLAALLALGTLVTATSACSDDNKLRINGISPRTGPPGGGDPVRINGNGFQAGGAKGIKVYFGNAEGHNIVFENDETIRVEPPPGEVGQVVDIVIMFDDARTATLEKAYTYADLQQGLDVDSLTKKDDK